MSGSLAIDQTNSRSSAWHYQHADATDAADADG